MEGFFNNPWVVGIGAGVLSSLVVAIVTRYMFSRRDNREYVRRISQANQEVLYAVRPGISEGVIPRNDVLQRLASATARRYGIEVADLFDLDEFASELTKEVMDSSFISALTKEDFCEKLSSIKEEAIDRTPKESKPDFEKAARYRWQMVATMSLMVGMMTAIVGFITSLESRAISEPKQMLFLLVPAVVAVLAAFLTALLKDSKMRLRTMEVRLGGIRASLYSKHQEDDEDSGKANVVGARSSR